MLFLLFVCVGWEWMFVGVVCSCFWVGWCRLCLGVCLFLVWFSVG